MKKRFLLTSVLMLLLTVLALSTSTYAWFTMSSDVYVNQFNVTAVQTTGGMDISTDGSSWATDKKVTVTTSNPAYDLTSDANGVIYKNTGSGTTVKLAVADSTAYNTFYLYFKTTSYGKIQLDLEESYIVPTAYASYVTEDGNYQSSEDFVEDALDAESDLDAASITNKSTSGDFSRDWIAAAFRMSFKVVGYQKDTKANYEITNDATSLTAASYTPTVKFVKSLDEVKLSQHSITGKYSITDGASGNTVYGVEAVSGSQGEYQIKSTTDYTASSLLTENGTLDICTISDQTGDLPFDTGKTYIVKVEVKIWVEGQDNEAILPLTGGQVTSALKFKISTKDVTDPTDYRTAISFTNAKGTTSGLTFTAPTAAIINNGQITVYKNTVSGLGIVDEADLLTLPAGLDTLSNNASSYTDGTFTVGDTYVIVAPVTLSDDKASGYKAEHYFYVGTQAYIYQEITIGNN